MKRELMRRPLILAVSLLLTLGMTSACDNTSEEIPGGTTAVAESNAARAVTLENLQSAYDSETNTAAKYLAFAASADKQGNPKAASMFRAAARAEQIHAANHAEVIRSMGAEPTAVLKTPEIGLTATNLWMAIKDETYERDTLYPGFIRQAREAGNEPALRTFKLARSAETGHALLFSAVAETLKDRGSVATQYFVCPGCGFTRTGATTMDKCPACGTSTSEFISVK